MFDPDRQEGMRRHSLLSLAPKPGDRTDPAASARAAEAGEDASPFARHQAARRRGPQPAPLARSAEAETGPAGKAAAAAVETPSPEAPRTEGAWRRVHDFAGGLRARFLDGLARPPEAAEPAPPEEPAAPARGEAAAPRAPSRELDDAPPAPIPPRIVPDPAYDEQYWRPLIDPAKVVAGVMNSKRLIAVLTVLGALLGAYVALSTPKKYQSTAEVIVDPRNLQLVERDLTDNGLSTEASLAVVENQARIITSGSVLNKVVDQLHLDDDPEFNGEGGHHGLGAIVSALRSLLSRPGGHEGDVKRALAVSNLAESLNVQRTGKTFVVDVAATTKDPQKSALIANTVVKVFVETSGQIQSETAARASRELDSRLNELRASVEAAERKAETYRSEHDLVDAEGKLISDDQLLKLNDQLSTARAREAELKARASSIQGLNVNSVVNGVLPEQIGSPLMTELRTQYATLKQESDRLAVKLGPRHPQRLAIDAQLAGARAQIAAELHRIAASIEVERKRAEHLEQDLSAQLARLKVKQGDVSSDLVALRELERDAAAKRSVYEAYLLRAKQTGEQKDISTANISVISKAYPPLTADGPSRVVMAAAGAFLGLLFGIAIGAGRGTLASLRDSAAPEDSRRRVAGSPMPPAGEPPAGEAGARNDEPPAGRAEKAPAPAAEAAAGEGRGARAPGESDERLIARLSERLDALVGETRAPRADVAPGRWEARHAGGAADERFGREGADARRAGRRLEPGRFADRWPDFPASVPARPGSRGEMRKDVRRPAFPEPPRRPAEEDEPSAIEEVRESLREFRKAVRDLAELRARRGI